MSSRNKIAQKMNTDRETNSQLTYNLTCCHLGFCDAAEACWAHNDSVRVRVVLGLGWC